ncbi:adhesin, partial [Sphingobacteriales bacterium UPWRP_1]
MVAAGGTGAVTYAWSHNPALSGGLASGIPGGIYEVTVTDSNGCTNSANMTVPNSDGPQLYLSETNPTCGNSNGSISALGVGGFGGYNYEWSHDSSLNGALATGLSPGSYTVTITDGNGCSSQESITLNTSTSATVALSGNNAACGLNNGSINLSASGGTAPYTYSWSNGANTQNLSNLAPGSYSVTVTTAGGCTASAVTSITNLAGPTSAVVASSALCGNANGGMNLTVSGGTPPYDYNWSNGNSFEDLVGASAGLYTVTVTDANNCTTVAGATITNINGPAASAVVLNAYCGINNGSVNVTVTGGTAPYTYTWNNGAATQDLPAVSAGSYDLTIT